MKQSVYYCGQRTAALAISDPRATSADQCLAMDVMYFICVCVLVLTKHVDDKNMLSHLHWAMYGADFEAEKVNGASKQKE